LNKNLLKYNLGYIGILGLLALVILSYTTIFFTKHGYVHNLIVHAIGLISFAFFFCKLRLNKDYILLIIFISADKIVSIFSDNPNVISFGTTYLKISALIFPAYPVFFISNGFFMAIKKSNYSMYLNIIRNVILFIPTIIITKMLDESFQTFFWSYCFFNWLYVLCLFAFVSAYIKRNLN